MCSGVFRLKTFWKVERGHQGGSSKIGQNSIWVKPDIFKKAAPTVAKILGGVKFQHFGPPLSANKVLLTAESGVGPKLTKISGWRKTRTS